MSNKIIKAHCLGYYHLKMFLIIRLSTQTWIIMDPKYSQTGFKYHIIVLQKQLHMATTTDLLGYVMDRIGYCVTYHPYTYITYQILHYSPLIISQSLRSLDTNIPNFQLQFQISISWSKTVLMLLMVHLKTIVS